MSLLPWHNLRYWYSLSHLRDQTSDTGAVILPRGAELWGVPMHYEHLWKIRSPLYQVEGFEMKHFDEIIEGASDTSDANVEPHPLWEYPGRAQSAPAMLIKFDFAQKVPKKNVEKEVVFDLGGGFGNTNGTDS
jgi:protein arginine N-methyltransferase 7